MGDRLRAVAGAVALSVEDFEGDRLERQQNPPSPALALALVGAGVGLRLVQPWRVFCDQPFPGPGSGCVGFVWRLV